MLEYDPGLAIYAIITFLVLFVLLWKLAWPKIIGAIEEREEKIRNSLEEAEKAREAAERTTAEYQEMIAKAREESAEIIRKGTEQAEKVREDLIAKAKDDATKFVENTKKELELERDKAIQEMKLKVVDLSVAIATKIVKTSLTEEKQMELARQALKEMELN
ncbi:F0F1 ATP synthase subunit B [candidate division KSB1 bacterium]